ncbi:Hypothetical predicted protein [Mytilus galloprovincialis]|uniref:Uncharacterized protein n=1 Tax=Mytilus galloprovincialis TaxID=29158 RepID=A0A8B6E360_MYTGA|nr:Hypothetical predicted protein [Mytilus galloprovincialis]
MDGIMPRDSLFQLRDMFVAPDQGDDSDSDIDDSPIGGVNKLGPGDLGPQKKEAAPKGIEKTQKKKTKDIWDDDEVVEGSEYDTIYDPRPQPDYDIIYKQAITSEDMFLQMGNKNNATASCEDMVVKIELPGTKGSDIELDVKSKFLDCRTPRRIMMKIFLFGLLVVGAMAQFPGLMGGFGGQLPSGAMDMLKDLKPDDIKNAIKHMSPEMRDMARSMGITEDQIKNAVKNMPEDFDVSSMVSGLSGKMADNKDAMKDMMMKEMSEMKEQMKEESVKDFKNEMDNFGFDLSQGASGLRGQILPKMTEMMGENLRYEGIDTNDHEALRKNVHVEIRMMIGAKGDATNDEVRRMLKEKIMEEMKEEGVEFNKEKAQGEFKKAMMEELKDMGMDAKDDIDPSSLKDMLRTAMKSGKMGNTQGMMQQFLPMMMNLDIKIDA